MKRALYLAAFVVQAYAGVYAQQLPISLTFTATDSTNWIQLDSIKVMNRSQGGDTVLYWPDTLLVLDNTVGMAEPGTAQFGLSVSQNYPNPVSDRTYINVKTPCDGTVTVLITDILGRKIHNFRQRLEAGDHLFEFYPGSGMTYIFTAVWEGFSQSVKILNLPWFGTRISRLEYAGNIGIDSVVKSGHPGGGFVYSLGDQLLFIGYADTLESGFLDIPDTSSSYTFQFGHNMPCLGIPSVVYGGKVYQTIQVFSQCWLKENLDAGLMIPGADTMKDNGILEKYCYNNEEDSCQKYGGLYQWDEMMQYARGYRERGICPEGWHLPSDEEWRVLQGAVDSQCGIGDPEWDDNAPVMGFDVGLNLKSTYGWTQGGNGTDLYDFHALPAGVRHFYIGEFHAIGSHAGWYTSDEYDDDEAWRRGIHYSEMEIRASKDFKTTGTSVRCLRDMEEPSNVVELYFRAKDGAYFISMDSIKIMNRTNHCDTVLYYPDTVLTMEYFPGEAKDFTGKSEDAFNLYLGDNLLFIGYYDTLDSGIPDTLSQSDVFTFQFGHNYPCLGVPYVNYEGQVYSTIQVFSQCWLRENLNVGIMIPANQYMTDNGILEKYCYNNEEDSCTKYGAYYQWDEIMHYANSTYVQGICPSGWHIPTDEEYKILEGAADSEYGIGELVWDAYNQRGTDVGFNLKSTEYWNHGTDQLGFSSIPSGFVNVIGGTFDGLGFVTYYWSSSEYNIFNKWCRELILNSPQSSRFDLNKQAAISVRCIKNY